MQYYNSHSHIFTMHDAPDRFLDLYMPKWLTNLVNTATNTDAGAKIVESILNILPFNGPKRYASFLKIGKSASQLEVFADLLKQYEIADPNMKFSTLSLNMDYLGLEVQNPKFNGQIQGILDVKAHYPDRLLVFFGLDPRWISDAKELQKTVEKYFTTKLSITGLTEVYPFAGLKIYPCNGFFAFDENLFPTFEWAEENEIPIIAHCSYLGGIFHDNLGYIKSVFNKYSSIYPLPPKSPIQPLPKKIMNQEACSYFIEPYSYLPLLAKFPRLKLCFAHYGGAEHILAAHGGNAPKSLFSVEQLNWCTQIQNLMKRKEEFPNIYTDVSYSISYKNKNIFKRNKNEIYKPLFEDLQNPNFQKKILFGTDFFMTERDMPETEDYITFKQNAQKISISTGITAWDQMASINTDEFLKNKILTIK